MSETTVVCICGGGNGAHVLAGLASARPNIEARVLTLYADEAEKWTAAAAVGGGGLTVQFNLEGQDPQPDLNSPGPRIVTKDPAVALDGAHLVVLTVPAFAHGQYFAAMAPHVRPGLIVAGMPGRPGFEFESRSNFGENIKHVTMMSFETLPWACRIAEFGRKVTVIGIKEQIDGSLSVGDTAAPGDRQPVETLQRCLGPRPVLRTSGDLLAITLTSPGSYVHTSIMHGKWHNWDGQPFKEKPLFYQGLDEATAETMGKMSSEAVEVAKAISAKFPKVDLSPVKHIYDWYMACYSKEIDDPTTLYTAIRTNKAYTGLTHPMKESANGLVPDFGYRYLSEDVPCGLAVTKGVAQAVGVATPTIDQVLKWCQEKLGKEFIVNGELKGKDLDVTRAPQKYGFHKVEDFI